MPVLVIAVIVVLAIGAGAYFFSTEETAAPTVEREVETARPETTNGPDGDEDIEPETNSEPEPVVETDTTLDVAPELPTEVVEPEPATVSEVAEPEPVVVPASEFADGSYTTRVSYLTPSRSSHDMDVTLTIENDVVVASSITYDGGDGPGNSHHRRFDAAYKSEVVGMQLSEISLSRVGGASLTSASFNEAVANVGAEARS